MESDHSLLYARPTLPEPPTNLKTFTGMNNGDDIVLLNASQDHGMINFNWSIDRPSLFVVVVNLSMNR